MAQGGGIDLGPAERLGAVRDLALQVGQVDLVVVDDADAWAGQARANGLDPQGPMDAHGERIYMLTGPGGLQVSIQSAA